MAAQHGGVLLADRTFHKDITRMEYAHIQFKSQLLSMLSSINRSLMPAKRRWIRELVSHRVIMGGGVSEFITASHDGSEATDGDYKVVTFNSSGTFTVDELGADPTDGDKVEYLVVGGGGGGGHPRRFN